MEAVKEFLFVKHKRLGKFCLGMALIILIQILGVLLVGIYALIMG